MLKNRNMRISNIENRSPFYVVTIENKNEEQVLLIKKRLEIVLGCKLRLRGRHSNRKKVLGYKWRENKQNDIPWRLAETIAIYKK